MLADQALHFPGAPGYLNTASIGLPPVQTVEAMRNALSDWQLGRSRAQEYDATVTAARHAFARLVGVPPPSVAIGAQVSALVGLAATLVEPGGRIVVPVGEFTSVLFPLVRRSDLEVDVVPLDQIADRITSAVDLVAFSAVQSSTGQLADLDAITDAAATSDAITLVDLTQAAGWLPVDASRFDVTVTSAYKWLLSPRGTAFLTVGASVLDRIEPIYAGWYAGDSPWESIYGMPLRLAGDARRLDLSPAWLSWVGTAPALEFIEATGVDTIHEHNVALANELQSALGMEPGDSAIVSLELAADFDEDRLAGLATAYRAGRLRVSFHLYNTGDDVERLVEALGELPADSGVST